MVSRLIERLRGSPTPTDSGLLRPNQLRLQDVVAQRQRREASQATSQAVARHAPRPRPLETDLPALRSTRRAPTPPHPARSAWLRTALSSRDSLRQAMLLREVLDPPLSLRDQETGRSRY